MPTSLIRFCRATLVVALLIAFVPPAGADLAPAWINEFQAPAPAGFLTIETSRMLADGSYMELLRLGYGTMHVATRYDTAGTRLTTSLPMPIDAINARLAIGPFGEVYASGFALNTDVTDSSKYSLRAWKYDGHTGTSLWPNPVVNAITRSGFPGISAVAIDTHGNLVGCGTEGTVIFAAKWSGVDGTLLWARTYAGGTSNLRVAVASDDTIAIAAPNGTSVRTMKLDTAGNPLWTRDLATGSASETPVIRGVAVTPDGSVTVAASGAAAAGDTRIFIARYASGGTPLWSADQATGSVSFVHLRCDSAGHAFVAATLDSAASALVVKYTPDGALAWSSGYNAFGSDFVAGIAADGNGNAIVSIRSDAGGANGMDVVAVKFAAANGSTLWTYRDARSGNIEAAQPVVDPAGNVFVGGYFTTSPLLFRVNGATGGLLWSAVHPNSRGQDRSRGAVVDASGDVIAAIDSGSSYGNGAMAAVKYAPATGAVIWSSKVDNGQIATSANAIAVDSAGYVFVAGVQIGPESLVLAQFNSAGAFQWMRKLSITTPSVKALATDAAGNVIVLGGTWVSGNRNVVTAKYDRNGNLIWQRMYDSGSADDPAAVAVDPAGDVVVAIDADVWQVVKYAAADGTPIWTTPWSSGLGPKAMVISAAGDIYVTGEGPAPSFADIATIGLNSAGAIQWSVSYSNFGSDSPTDIELDGTDLLVAGRSASPLNASRNDYVILRYATSNGAQQSIIRYADPLLVGFYFNHPVHIGLDTSGNIVLGGSAYRDARRDDDAVFLKFSPAGAIVAGPLYIDRGVDDRLVSLVMSGDTIFAAMATGEIRSDAYTMRVDAALAIVTATDQLPPGYCGRPYSASVVAVNGTAPLVWSVVSGALPNGVTLDPSTGALSGTPSDVQSSSFRLRVTDASSTLVERDFTVGIDPNADRVPIVATPNPACGATTLSIPPGFTVRSWMPGGESTSTIVVTPSHPSVYGVELDQGGSCITRGAIDLPAIQSLSAVTITLSGSATLCSAPTAGTVTVADTGGGVNAHQWGYRTTSGGPITDIAGQTGTSYVITASDFAGGATYYLVCRTTPSCGNPTTSNEIVVSISDATPPTSLLATATGDNAISLSWSAGSGSGTHHYNIYRSSRLCPGLTFTKIGQTTGMETTFTDNSVVTGGSYSYKVTAANSSNSCETGFSNCDDAVAYGSCALAPTFAGAASAAANGCFIRVSWSAGTSNCPSFPTVVYNVYRSTSSTFTPSAANRIASCVINTTYDDDTVTAGTTYYYVVRAEDSSTGNGGPCNTGNQDANVIRRSAMATGSAVTSTLYADAFEAPNRPPSNPDAYWIEQASAGGDHLSLSTCRSASTTTSYKWGSTGACPGTYLPNVTSNLILGGNGSVSASINGIAIPSSLTNVRLLFNHYRDSETSWDGAALYYSTTGAAGTFTLVNDSVTAGQPYILSGGYNGTLNIDGNHRAWMGVFPSFTPVVVNLNALVGQTVWFRWRFVSDGSVEQEGYYLDDVRITGDTAISCSTPPNPVQALSVTSTNGSNQIEWLNPSVGSYGATMIRFRTDTFPASTVDGTLATTRTGAAGERDSWTHSGLTNGTTYYYAAFVDNGFGVWSRNRTVAARPQLVNGVVKWVYATGASAMTPPGIGSVFAVSNDRILHSMNTGTSGGQWPSAWKPMVMNAPSQARPPVPSFTLGAATKEVYLGSQDGHVYCVDGNTGAQIWRTATPIAEMVQGAANGMFTVYGAAYDLTLVGTRNSSSVNRFVALDARTGAERWAFDNGGGASASDAIGVITGDAAVEYDNRVFFASRTKSGGSNQTVWALSFTDTGATKLWSAAIGDSDGSPTVWNDRVYIGTNNGTVYALDETTGAVLWSYATNDGPVKGFVNVDFLSASGRLYFATTNKVWSVTDSGASATLNWSVSLTRPSIPLYTGTALIMGSGDGRLYQFTNLSSATPTQTSVVLGAGTAGVGSPSLDYASSMIYVGNEAGAIYGVSLPLP
ncbi:MAG TPA: PQQ-binding-like beta-propeller repeat protein [Thermoanaerobaculia bacterium]|jgi:outer membrane protein assembly factor BamB|nr:PQQ-binding-like beta-propeller repeat protein [Thermoanaerobaculia bacterium]